VPEWLIIIGSGVFIAVLWLSAYYEADIRWLHFFQAWMYLAAVALAMRGNRWGYFIGFSAAVFWDYNIFVNTFVRSGLHWLAEWIRTGHLRRIDQIIAVPAWLGNLMVVVGSLWGYARLRHKDRLDVARIVAAFLLTTAFFAADMAIFQPRYLSLFRGALHPHRPW
jgi:hypothetical protein